MRLEFLTLSEIIFFLDLACYLNKIAPVLENLVRTKSTMAVQ